METFLDMLRLKGCGIDENWGMAGKMEGKPKDSDLESFSEDLRCDIKRFRRDFPNG